MKNTFFFVALLFLVACSETKPNQVKDQSKAEFSKLDSLNELIRDKPNELSLFLERAKISRDSLDLNSAYQDIDIVIGMDSSNAMAYLLKAQFLFDEGKIKTSHTAVTKSLSLDDNSIEGYTLLSKIYLLVKNHEESILAADEVLKRDLYNAQAYYLKGFNFKEAGYTTKAVSSFLTATEQDPDYYEAWMELGMLFGLTRHPNTEFYYDNALRIQTESTEALYNQALFFQEAGKEEDAIQNYRLMNALDSTDYRPFYNIAYVFLVKKEQYDSAGYYFQESLKLNGENPDAYYNLGLSQELEGNMSEAINSYRKALEVLPNHDLAARALQRIMG